MTIKISQLGTIGAVQGNTLVPIVGNVGGTLTTLQSNVSQLQTYIIGTAFTDIANLYANATATSYSFANVWANLNNVATSLSSLNSIESSANIGMHGYVDNAISTNVSIVNASISAANVGMLGYVNTVVSNVTTITNQIANIATYSNVNVRSYLNSVNIAPYSNVNVASYLTAQNITSYSNVQVAAYLTGSISTGSIAVSGNVTATSGNVWVKYIKITPSTVANLVSAATAGTGARAFVTDANSNTFANLVVGGGIYNIPVFSNGTNWYVG